MTLRYRGRPRWRLRRFLPLKVGELTWIAFPYKRFSEHQHAKCEFDQTSAAVRYTVPGVPGSYRRHPGGRLQRSLPFQIEKNENQSCFFFDPNLIHGFFLHDDLSHDMYEILMPP